MGSKKLKSYVDAMRDFRGGRQQAAVVEVPRRRKKKSGRSAMALIGGTHKNLTRTRKTVTVSKAHRSMGRTRTTSGVIPGTTRARESTMPRASRRKSLAAKRRKRDRYGHFMELSNPRKAKRKAKRSSGRRTTKTTRRPAKRAARRTKRSAPRRAKTGRYRSLKRKRPGHHKHSVRSHLRKVPGRKTRVRVKRHRSHEVAAENPRKRKHTAKRRGSLKRKRPGHRKHTVRGHLRKVPGRRKRVLVKRHRSHESAAETPRKNVRRRPRRAARAREEIMAAVNPRRKARKTRRRARAREEVVVYENPRKSKRRGKKRKGVKGRRRHTVRGHYRKPIRRRKATRSGKRRVHVKRHLSWEEEAKNARRRGKRRAKRRHTARETIAANPRRKKSRRRSRGVSRATVPAVVRRRVGGRTRAMPAAIHIHMGTVKRRSGGKARRRSGKRGSRRGTTRKAGRKSTRRSGKRGTRRGTRRTPLSHRLPPASEFFENPRYGMVPYGQNGMHGMHGDEEYALENPLSGGELALAFVTGGIGFAVTDLLDRYLATSATPPANLPNIAAIDSAPGITRILAQAGMTALPFIGAYFVKQPMGRAALQGFGLGAGIHLVGQLIKSYVMAKALANNATGQRLYAEAIAANQVATAAAGGTGATGATGAAVASAYSAVASAAGVSGLPFGLGAPMLGIGAMSRQHPYGMQHRAQGRYMDVGPQATHGVRGVGATAALAPSTVVLPNNPPAMTAQPGGAPAPTCPDGSLAPNGDVTQCAQSTQPQPGCNPCGPTTEYQTAQQLANLMPVASAETMQATIDSAYRAAQAEVCGPGNPGQSFTGGMGAPPAAPAAPAVIPGGVGAPPGANGAARPRTKVFASFPD